MLSFHQPEGQKHVGVEIEENATEIISFRTKTVGKKHLRKYAKMKMLIKVYSLSYRVGTYSSKVGSKPRTGGKIYM